MKSEKTAFEAATFLLNYRAQSEKELRTKLSRKGYGEEEIEKALEKCRYYRYIDDETLAADLMENFRQNKLYGSRYIRQKLRERGLPADVVLSAEEEREKAAEALRRKYKAPPKDPADRRRAYGFLARRGFSQDAISFALGNFEALEEEFPDDFIE